MCSGVGSLLLSTLIKGHKLHTHCWNVNTCMDVISSGVSPGNKPVNLYDFECKNSILECGLYFRARVSVSHSANGPLTISRVASIDRLLPLSLGSSG